MNTVMTTVQEVLGPLRCASITVPHEVKEGEWKQYLEPWFLSQPPPKKGKIYQLFFGNDSSVKEYTLTLLEVDADQESSPSSSS